MKSWSKKPSDGESEESPEGGAAAAEAAAPREPVKPAGWAEKSKRGQKAWGERSRADDPDKRTVLPPLASGVGDGKYFSFLFGLKIHAPNDRRLFAQAREHIDDDVEVLRRAGYTCVIDEQAVHEDFLDAVYGRAEDTAGLQPAGLFWLAHGHADGAIETCDGGVVQPADLDPEQVSPSLKLVVFAACYVGSRTRSWRSQLGGRPLVVGWGRPVTIDRAVDFLTPAEDTATDLDDLLARYLLAEAEVPREVEVRWSPLASAAAAGRSADLPERLEAVLALLQAKKIAADDSGVVVDVPIGVESAAPSQPPRRRWHRAKLFVVDAAEPFIEGELVVGVECDVGEISAVVDPAMLLSGIPDNRYARATLVQSETEAPRIVTQGFMPLQRVRDTDIAALAFQTCAYADTLERRIFGGDSG